MRIMVGFHITKKCVVVLVSDGCGTWKLSQLGALVYLQVLLGFVLPQKQSE